MTSLTWSFDTGGTLLGCGVDCEAQDRFDKIVGGEAHPMPFAFTQREVDHARSQRQCARLLCLSFTCKEAFQKAVGRPFDYTACELFPVLQDELSVYEGELVLAPKLKEDLGVSRAFCRSFVCPMERGEIISAVYALGGGRP